MQSQLDPRFYYLSNFRQALTWLQERYADLLSEAEHDFVRQFFAIDTPAQALLVRMIMRKGSHFRLSKLSYEEIGCARLAAEPLFDAGWIRHDAELSLEELFKLLRKDEVLQHLAGHGSRKSQNKSELMAQLAEACAGPRTFAEWCPGSEEQVFSLTVDALCERLRLIFFGNLRQDWSEFVLAELGIFRYERVELTTDSRAFRHRSDVDCYLHLQRSHEQFEAGEPLANVLQQISAVVCDTPSWPRDVISCCSVWGSSWSVKLT